MSGTLQTYNKGQVKLNSELLPWTQVEKSENFKLIYANILKWSKWLRMSIREKLEKST